MYLPPTFREDDMELQQQLMQKNPLAVVITSGEGGLMANLIPCMFVRGDQGIGMLRFHVSRANSQAAELRSVNECLVVFQGAQTYITPSWYPSKVETGKVVPTWNYATVHAWGTPRVIDNDDTWLRRHLEDLTRSQEAERPTPWKPDDAPPNFIVARIKAIVGVEITITRTEGKWKVSQNRTRDDRKGVIDGLTRDGGLHAAAMSALVSERASDL